MSTKHVSLPEDELARWGSLYLGAERLYEVPILLEAEVVHGFKRGSKELGIPTANLSMPELGDQGSSLDTGIYFGWTLLRGEIYESVTSVGWNPYFKNSVKTIEVHILDKLEDFYGERIYVVLCGYLRQETNFNSLDDLISCIHSDIIRTRKYLLESKASELRDLSAWASLKDGVHTDR